MHCEDGSASMIFQWCGVGFYFEDNHKWIWAVYKINRCDVEEHHTTRQARVKLFKEQLFWSKPRNTGLPENNQERHPITIELNQNAVTLCTR